jgi:hypothetical protein
MLEPELEVDASDLRIEFEYDFGAGWEYEIKLFGMAPPTIRLDLRISNRMQVLCYQGQGAKVTEDCGGTAKWIKFKRAFDPEMPDSAAQASLRD